MKLTAVILAAGQSRRFDGIKQLASIDGQPLLAQVCRHTEKAVPGHTYVILGANADLVRPVVPDRVKVLVNEVWQEGISSSIQVACKQAIRQGYSHLMVTLGDQVGIGANQLKLLLNQAHLQPSKIICSRYNGIVGVPAVFPASCFPALMTLKGDKGAKALLERFPEQCHEVEISQAQFDIDTRKDLQNWIKKTAN